MSDLRLIGKKVSAIFLLLLVSQATSFIPYSNAVTPGTTLQASLAISSGRLNATFSADSHFFKTNMQAGTLLSIRLQVPSGSDLDLTLYDPDSTNDDLKRLTESTALGQGVNEFIEYRAVKTGFHYIRVTGTRYTGTGLYALALFATDFRVLFAGFGTQDSQVEVAPGDLGSTLSLVIRNGGDFAITDFVATVNLPSQFTNSTSGNLLRQTITTSVAPGQSGTFTYLVNIATAAAIAKYPLTVALDYVMSNGFVKGISVNVPIQISVTGRSIIRLTSENQFLLPESTNDVTLKIKNEGTAATGIIDFTLTVPSPLTLVGTDNKWTLSPLLPNQEVSISAKVFAPATSKGQSFQLPGTVTYKTAVGSSRTETRIVSLVVQAIGRGVVSVVNTEWATQGVPMQVAPGDKRVTLMVTIQNLDNGPITGITQILKLLGPFTNTTGGSTIRNFYPGTVQSGGSANTEYLLNVAENAQVRTYSLSMTVSYLDQRSLFQTVELPVSVTIVGRSNIRVTLQSNVVIGGTANDVLVEITNFGTAPAYIANVGLSFATASSMSVVGGDSQRLIDVIDSGAKVTIPYRIYVSPSAAEGLYSSTLSIAYRDVNGRATSETKSLGFVVKAWSNQIITESVDTILLAGSQNKVTIKVRNTGSQTISSVIATLSFPSAQAGSALSLASGSPQFTFDQISSKGEALMTAVMFATPASADSSPQVQIQFSYLDASGYPHSESKTLNFAVRGWVSPLVVETQGSILAAGTINEVPIAIKNTGSQPVSSVQATLSFPTVSGGTPLSLATGSSQWNFEQITARGEVSVKPQIFATLSATDSSYHVQIQLTYVDANGYQHTETKSVGLSVRGRIVIDTQGLSVVPPEVGPGRNVTVIGNILNKGNVASHFTETRIKSEGPIRTTAASTQYIGEVDPNTPVPFSLNFQIDRQAGVGTYPVTVQFIYEDSYGRKMTTESKLELRVGEGRLQPLQIRTAPDAFPQDTARMIFIAGFTIILVAGLVMIIRARRKSNRVVV